MNDTKRFMVWVSISCMSGVIYSGLMWLGCHYLGWSLGWIPLTFAVAFVGVLYAGALCCASAARGE